MVKRNEWRGAWWPRRRAVASEASGPVLSPERARELEQPTFLRRGLSIGELGNGRGRPETAARG